MRRLTLFAKGNVDVHDTLHSCRIGGKLLWNGINEVLRVRHPGCLSRLKHETWTRSDALLQATGKVPEAVQSRHLPMGAYPAEIQFSRAVLETKADAIVLTVQPDIMTSMLKHKHEGFLFYPSDSVDWSAQDREWLKSEFEPAAGLDVAQSMANFGSIISTIRQQSEAPILIFNLSSITPGEAINCYEGFDEVQSTRIRRFNLGLIDLSARTGVSIIDVDSLLARKGADALKIDALHLTAEGYRLIAEEVVRVLADLGVMDEEKN